MCLPTIALAHTSLHPPWPRSVFTNATRADAILLVAAAEVESLLQKGVFCLSGNARPDHHRHASRVVQPETNIELASLVGTADPQASAQQDTATRSGGERDL